MDIGIDLDEVLAEFVTAFLAYHNTAYGTAFHRNQMSCYNGWSRTSREETERIHDFFKTPYFEEIVPVNGSQQGTKVLSREHQLVVITARPTEMYQKTQQWVKRYFPSQISAVNLTNQFARKSGSAVSKSSLCRDSGISIMIEDSLDQARDCAAIGVQTLLLDCPWNQTSELAPGIQRVYSWDEIVQRIST